MDSYEYIWLFCESFKLHFSSYNPVAIGDEGCKNKDLELRSKDCISSMDINKYLSFVKGMNCYPNYSSVDLMAQMEESHGLPWMMSCLHSHRL